ncbi:DDB1- and CUL4-associated factor 11 [Aethina tumida]|uniref:DDB1- and CUL4-associated factor 11 n=1 Tax=Aethina tumida TaxID=116153 RepID=UPI00096B4E09|nr:DDB1- and CUL4-associated factor 11 [Aethina tumida]
MGARSTRMSDDMSSSVSGASSENESEEENDLLQRYADIIESAFDSAHSYIMGFDFHDLNNPIKKVKQPKPNTRELDQSSYSAMTKLASGLGEPKRKVPKTSKHVVNMLSQRENGTCATNNFSYGNRCSITNKYLPNEMQQIDTSIGKLFCGVFSKDGNRFITASQDRHLRIYNSEVPSYKLMKAFRARDVGWSIIDVAFSPDRQHFVYSTWSSALHLCSVNDSSEQEPLCLMDSGRRFCIFSVVFSADGRELLGGANDACIYIYDRQRHSQTLKIPAHEYDVNSVVFADESCQIIYSGGDDGMVRVWDRRALDESRPKHVGCLAGHVDGVTHVDSRGDGRHLISNSKDQSIKLWDIRRFSSESAASAALKVVQDQTWDYRWQEVPKKLFGYRNKLDGDTSVMTYRGHVVIKTLVRCRFSPVETTGQRYIYTGCGMGRVVIYDSLTGKMVQNNNNRHASCVRDVSWHPTRNEILSCGWDGLVGKWIYVDQDIAEERKKEINLMDDYLSSCKQFVPLRRSVRLANRKRRESRNHNC